MNVVILKRGFSFQVQFYGSLNVKPCHDTVNLKTQCKVATPCVNSLKDQCSTLCLLITTQFKVLASFNGELSLGLACCAFQTEHNFLCTIPLVVVQRHID